MVKVNVQGGTLKQEEINAYIARGKKQAPDKLLTEVDIKLDGEWADISYHYTNPSFERIRRITGYLVGTLDRFNNAKRAEEHDRVKHSLS